MLVHGKANPPKPVAQSGGPRGRQSAHPFKAPAGPPAMIQPSRRQPEAQSDEPKDLHPLRNRPAERVAGKHAQEHVAE